MSERTINLLSKSEVSDIYDSPDFDDHERDLYFAIDENEADILAHFHTVNTKIFFILQLGYFKAKHRFFRIDAKKARRDINFINKKFYQNKSTFTPISREPGYQQRKLILSYFKYQECSDIQLHKLKEQFLLLLKLCPRPQNAIRELITYCDTQNIILPGYRKLQDMYTECVSIEMRRISKVIDGFPLKVMNEIEELISHTSGLVSLNDIRYDQSDFSYSEIIEETSKVRELSSLYLFCKQQIPILGLSQNAIRITVIMLNNTQ